jgi:hypothetical protein
MSAHKPPLSHTRHEPNNSWPGDAHSLEARLKEKIDGEVRFDSGSRALYSTDSSNYRQIPIGVVLPKTIEDIVNTVSICREFKAPILSNLQRGCRPGFFQIPPQNH